MQKKCISVIVPVYNTEAYLEKCLDSLLVQTYQNWEAILVDDGSSDGSGRICDCYAARDHRFRVIHKENEGVSIARNCAIMASTGEYISFLDSDDWLDEDTLGTIVGHFEKNHVDVVVTGWYDERPEGTIRHPSGTPFEGKANQTELAQQLFVLSSSYWGILCNKSFRRSCVFSEDSAPFLFPAGIKHAEDQYWLIHVYKNAKSAYFDPKSLYHYVSRSNSASNTFASSTSNVIDLFKTYQAICQYGIQEFGLNQDLVQARFIYHFFTGRLSTMYRTGNTSLYSFLLKNGKPYVEAMSQSPAFSQKEKQKARIYMTLMQIRFPVMIWDWLLAGQRLLKVIFKKLKVGMYRLLPLQNMILFEGYPDYSDNSYWFAKYLAENTDVFKRYKMVWHIPKKETAVDKLFGLPCISVARNDSGFWRRLRRYWYLSTARFIFDCNLSCHKRHPKQIRIHLCHGAPIKAIGFYGKSIGEKDLLIVPSEFWRPWFAEEMEQPMETTLPLGYPRNDILCQNNIIRIPALQDKKVLIWMPTFRQHARNFRTDYQMQQDLPLGFPILHTQQDVADLDSYLGEQNMILLLRPHPSQDLRALHLETQKNIWIADNDFLAEHGLQLYELLTMTDGLITDYSSVYYDYLLTGKPIALTPEDYIHFRQTFPIVVDYEKDLVGYRLNTMEELKTFLDNIKTGTDPERAEREAACDRFNANRSGNACETLYRYICTQFGL